MLIEFGIIEYKLILNFIYSFIYYLRRIFHKDDKPLYEIFTCFLGFLFSGFALIIIQHRTKKSSIDIVIENENEKQSKNFNERSQIKNTFNQIDEKKKKNIERRKKRKCSIFGYGSICQNVIHHFFFIIDPLNHLF